MQIRNPRWKRTPVAALAVCFLAALGSAQDAGVYRNTLTNRDVITLADAGFSQEFLVEMVATSRTRFDTTAEGLADLVKHGVKEDLIRAMRGAGSQTSAPGPAVSGSGPEKPIRIFVESAAHAPALSVSYPQTAQIVKTFGHNCPNVLVTSRREAATYTMVLEHQAGKLLARGGSRIVVFDRSGDIVYGASERALAKALRGFCAAAPGFVETRVGGSLADSMPGAR
jgi:hypothetical protein